MYYCVLYFKVQDAWDFWSLILALLLCGHVHVQVGTICRPVVLLCTLAKGGSVVWKPCVCLSVSAAYKPCLEVQAVSSGVVLHSYGYINSGLSWIPARHFRAWAEQVSGRTCQLTEVQLLWVWSFVLICLCAESNFFFSLQCMQLLN